VLFLAARLGVAGGTGTAGTATVTASATTASAGGPSGGDTDASEGGAGATTPTDSPTATPPGNWSAVVEQSPTVADGPGFGVLAALLGPLASGLLARRR